MDSVSIGAFAFGTVVGWCASLAIRGTSSFGLSKLGGLLGAIGGGVVVSLFKQPDTFAPYAIGLAAAFFLQRFYGHPAVQKEVDKAIRQKDGA